MRFPLILTLLAMSSLGCRSAQDFRIEADDEVYALVNDRRQRLFEEEGGLTIDPPENSLRARVVRGEVQELLNLGLADCIEIAAENNREYQRRKELLYLSALDLTLERWALGWIPDGFGDAGIAGLGDTATVASASANYGLLSRVLGSGAQFLADLGLAIAKDLSGGGGWTTQSSFSLLFTQPLMRGAGSRIAFEPLTQAERNLVYEVRRFERFRRELAVDLAGRMLQLLRSLDIIENERRNYDNVSKIRERNESLSAAGRLSDIQVDQALQNELTSEDRLISAIQSNAAALDSFKFLLGLPMDVELSIDPDELQRLAKIEPAFNGIEWTQAAELAYANRPDFMTIVDQVVDAERRSRVVADALRMGLDVSSSMSVQSDPDKPLKFDFRNVEWSLGLLLDLPIARLPERNNYRRALITWQFAARTAAETEDFIANELRDLLREVAARAESREIQISAVGLAEKRVESAGLNLQAGRASTRDLLEAQDALVSSRNAETRATIDYTLARLDLALAMGLLRVEPSGIRIVDPSTALPTEISE